ncbi:hypothetical protein LCGC14_1671670 [marine sediment metagenome]|uniref:Uncharacterized protein n=1 Tax=marine sediment metagenome TaxID=412755 RepID=A0A0F9IDJ2_9ZZZZ
MQYQKDEQIKGEEMSQDYISRWSVDETIFYHEGGAWGINKHGKTVWLGKERDIIKKHPVIGLTRRPQRSV